MKGDLIKKKIKHAKDPRCCEENEEYYLNRHLVKTPTSGMVYYYQRVGGLIVKTEITEDQWKKLYNFNRKTMRSSQKYYDEDYYRRFPVFMDDDGEEDDPLEHYADYNSRFCETDNVERMDRAKLLSKMTEFGRKFYQLYYVNGMNQSEIATELHIKQYRVSRLLRELDEAIEMEFLDDGERTQTEIQIQYIYNRYRKTGKLDNYEEVKVEDFLSNLQAWKYNRLQKWFYSEKELYRYGIKFLIRYRLENFADSYIYRAVFGLKDLKVRGYFISEMEHLPLEYQWLFVYLEREIEKRAERFKEPKDNNNEEFIKLLAKISKKAKMSPEDYFETKFLPYYRERTAKKRMEFAVKELGIYFIKETDNRPIAEQINAIIKKLPAKSRKLWQKMSVE